MRGSKFNAIKHGIFADLLPSGEDVRYLALLSALRRAIRPVDPPEEVLVEEFAFLYVRPARVYRTDSKVAPKAFEKIGEVLDVDRPPVETEFLDKKRKCWLLRKVRHQNSYFATKQASSVKLGEPSGQPVLPKLQVHLSLS